MTPVHLPADKAYEARIRDLVWSNNYGDYLTVVGTSYPATATLDEVQRGAVRPDSVMLSADGRHWLDAWHRGDESDSAVYVERHTIGGAVFHGWIDSASRRIIQTG
jgi:hypothetical protein